jgi:hypothetical protein
VLLVESFDVERATTGNLFAAHTRTLGQTPKKRAENSRKEFDGGTVRRRSREQ